MACTVPQTSRASSRSRACWLSQADRGSAANNSAGRKSISQEHDGARCSRHGPSASSQRANASAQRSYSPPATLSRMATAAEQPYDPTLVRKLRRAASWREVRTILSSAGSVPDAVDLCTALHCTQNILGKEVQSMPEEEAEQLRGFVKTTLVLMLDRSSTQPLGKGAQTMANALTSLARLHIRPQRAIMAGLCSRAMRCCSEATPQALANTAMGLALLRVQPAEEAGLIDAVIQLSYEKLHLFKLEETCQVLWALASLNVQVDRSAFLFSTALAYWPSQLQDSLESLTGRSSGGASSTQVSYQSLNGNSQAARPPTSSPGTTASGPASRLRLKPKNVVQLTFAYAKMDDQYIPEGAKDGQADEDVAVAFQLVLPEVMALIPSFSPQGLCLVLWAYAKLRVAPRAYPRLVWAAYPAVCAKLRRFTPHGLVMIVYALALSRFRHEPMLDVVTGQCTARMSGFSARDCASLAWSLGKLAYRDPDLMEAICDRYVAACGNAPPESIGIVSQMLKGVLLQRCLTPQLMQLLQAQAEKTLGSAERSAAVLQEVMDGYAQQQASDSRSTSKSQQALLFQHNSHLASLSLSASSASSNRSGSSNSSSYWTSSFRASSRAAGGGTAGVTNIRQRSNESGSSRFTSTASDAFAPASSNTSSSRSSSAGPSSKPQSRSASSQRAKDSERGEQASVSQLNTDAEADAVEREQPAASNGEGTQKKKVDAETEPQSKAVSPARPSRPAAPSETYVNSRHWGLTARSTSQSSQQGGGRGRGNSRDDSSRSGDSPRTLMPAPQAIFKSDEQPSRIEVPRTSQKLPEDSSRVNQNSLEGAVRPDAVTSTMRERDMNEQCMADMDAEEVYRSGGRKRQEALERSPFFREVCRVLRQTGEAVNTGSVGTGGILCDIVVSRSADSFRSDSVGVAMQPRSPGSDTVCLQLLEDEQLVAVVPRGQARCTPESAKSALLEDSEGFQSSSSGALAEAEDDEYSDWVSKVQSSRLGMQGVMWEPDGNSQLYSELLSYSMRVLTVTAVDWMHWGGSPMYRSTANAELSSRLKQARSVACSGQHLGLRPHMQACGVSAMSDTSPWSPPRTSFSYC